MRPNFYPQNEKENSEIFSSSFVSVQKTLTHLLAAQNIEGREGEKGSRRKIDKCGMEKVSSFLHRAHFAAMMVGGF
jgi:hypothetical protein